MTKQTYNRRTPDQIVADLEAKIAAVKNREVRKQAKANPAVKHGMIAIKSIDKAAGETTDTAALSALDDARAALAAWLAVEGLVVKPGDTETVAPKRGRPRKSAVGAG